MEKQYRVLSIGAHPDDADTSAGGLLLKLRDAGWEVRLLSVTDGSAGTYDLNVTRAQLAARRRAEAEASGRIFGGRYDVMDNEDGRLMPTLALREELIRYIRRFAPDVILTNRPNDYHADHRSTSLLVQDASFLLTVPRVCDDTKYLTHTPAILFWGDGFKKPYPFERDILVPVSQKRVDDLAMIASCHECQYFDWMYWPDHTDKIAWPREKQVADLAARYRRGLAQVRDEAEDALTAKYGADTAALITHLECFEISEYGEAPCAEFLRVAEAAE